MQTIYDVVSNALTYQGEAELGRATTAHLWSVKKVSVNGTETTTAYPIGAAGSPSEKQEFAWSDRANLTYSLTDVLTLPTLSVCTIASDNSDTTKAKVGDTVTLTIESASFLRTPVVTIAGNSATVAMVADQKHWTAEYEMQSTDTAGAVAFSIAFSNVGGREGVAVVATTDLSAVTFDKVVPTATVTMASNNATPTLAKVGDVITLTIATSEDALTPTVTISGGSAVVTGSAKAWTATRTVAGGDTAGAIPFVLNFTDTSYNPAAQITAVTSGSAVVLDKVAPTLASAVRGSDTQVTVTLSELAKASTITKANAGGFVVSKTGTPATTYAVSAIAPGATDDKVVLTVANMDASRTAGVTVTYAAGGNGTVTDLSGNALATNAVGVVVAAWDDAPVMVSAERLANTTVRVTLSEVCNTSTTTKANDGGFVVYEIGTPATTYAVSGIAPNGGNHDQVDLTVADMAASAAVGVKVTYVKGGNGTVADDLGTLMETNAAGVNASAWA